MDIFEPDFTLQFDYTQLPKVAVLTDNTEFISTTPGTLFEAKLKGFMPDGSVFTNNAVDIPNIAGGSATFPLPLDVYGDFYEGIYTFEYTATLNKGLGTEEIKIVTKTFDLKNPKVKPDIKLSANTLSSTLTSLDTTSYGENATVSRTHVVKYPINLEVPIADVTGSTASITLPQNVWTGVYTSVITSSVYFDEGDGFSQLIEYKFTDTYEIVYGMLYCMIKCSLSEMLKKVEAGDESAIKAAVKINLQINLYDAYNVCGDYEKAEELKSDILLTFQDCNCKCEDCENEEDVNDGLPREIIPVMAAVGGGALIPPFNYLFGNTLPNAGLGNESDVYQNTANGNVYKKIGNSWVLQGNNKGESGTGNYVYTGYASGFDGLGNAINFSTVPTSVHRYAAIRITVTPILGAINGATFAGYWYLFSSTKYEESPFTEGDNNFDTDLSLLYEYADKFVISIRLSFDLANSPYIQNTTFVVVSNPLLPNITPAGFVPQILTSTSGTLEAYCLVNNEITFRKHIGDWDTTGSPELIKGFINIYK